MAADAPQPGDEKGFEECDRVYFFSDEEGTAPFDFTGSSGAEKVRQELDAGLIFHDKIISDLRPKTGLVFLGDLIDHAPNEIKLLQKMIALKDKFPNRVCLIAGNRDINKLRMSDELLIIKKPTSYKQKCYENAIPMLSTIEELRQRAIYIEEHWDEEFMFSDLITDRMNSENKENKVKIEWTRTNGLAYHTQPFPRLSSLAPTFGAPKVMNNKIKEVFFNKIVTTVTDIFPHDTTLLEEGKVYYSRQHQVIAVFVCLLNTLMCGRCVSPPPGSELAEYHGLYLKYLQKSDILRIINVRGKYVLVSHGGVPGVPALTCPLGAPTDNGTKECALEDTIFCINKEYTDAVKTIRKFNNESAELDSNAEVLDLIQKYVFHSAQGNEWHNYKTSTDSPIVGHNFNPEGNLYAGGDMQPWSAAKADRSTDLLVSTDKKIVHYSVYGHRPQGLAPSVWKKQGDETTFICVDVSKVPGQVDKGTPLDTYNVFAMFVLSSDGKAKIFGRSFIGDDSKSLIPEFAIKVPSQEPEVYYVNDIEDYSTYKDRECKTDNKVTLKFKFMWMGNAIYNGANPTTFKSYYEIIEKIEEKQKLESKLGKRPKPDDPESYQTGGSRAAPLLAPLVGLLCAALASVFL